MKLSSTITATALSVLSLLASKTLAQSVVLSSTDGLTFISGSKTQKIPEGTAAPTGPYITYTSQITLSVAGLTGNITTDITGVISSTPTTLTGVLTTGTTTFVGNVTGNSTRTAAPQPTNTQPCNNYVEFCNRKYSNITMVGAHNSPFVRPGNSGSNQQLDVTAQLDDGIRFLQGQMHWPSNSSVPHFCHTTCDLLDAGPITEWLGKVYKWVDSHPYDVVTVLLENGNYSKPSLYAPYIQQTGILKYTYEAPYLPMKLDDWPTLENMIIHGKRVVMFLDYMANQVEYPWLLDEFSQMWESPFDPTNRAFPCTVQRPPGLNKNQSESRMYLINHNLNAEFNVFGADLLVPAVSLLNVTNGLTGYGSLGLAANNCRSDWGRAPNVLNVDYYNFGSFNGSVFEVAAQMNNVTYNRKCCGVVSGAVKLGSGLAVSSTMTILASLAVVWLTM